jgi:serine/threonine protein kinase
MRSEVERLNEALAGRYRVQRVLARNGFRVYLADNLKQHRGVALWVTVSPNPPWAKRFLRELSRTAQLDHPHILPLLDSGEACEFVYYVVPHVEGESLRERLRREKRVPVDEAVRITRQVADALSHAHSHAIVHLDIKPENILFVAGHAYVVDFDRAALRAALDETLTGSGVTIATPEYMSPEQAAGARDVDHRSDLYSLACVLYEMLIGNPPFVASDARAVLAKVIDETPTPVRRLRRGVPAAVNAALVRALAKLPADRFATALEFAEALGT